jgi:hypothetical protein
MLFYEMTKFHKVDGTSPVVFLQTALFCKEETFCFVWYIDIQMTCEMVFSFAEVHWSKYASSLKIKALVGRLHW